jgi:hypothetical protein
MTTSLLKKTGLSLGLSILLLYTSSCGTLMHPERKGQTGGQIDVGVAVLDGIGLLFFLVPGIIAFAVDFSNGTIYLPGGAVGALEIPETTDGMDAVVVGSEELTWERLEAVVSRPAGRTVDLDAPGTMVFRVATAE